MLPIVCYLDYDGVLDDDAVYRRQGRGLVLETPGRSLFEWAPILVDALAPYPDLRIVLSTSWVRELSYDRARAHLPLALALAARVIGATFHRREHGHTADLRWLWMQAGRGNQIAADVRRRGLTSWFAIDDAVSEFNADQARWFVPCKSTTGLASPEAQLALREMLERAHVQGPDRRS
jgi:hypothetical protein